jgi:hypothetical protein
MIANRVVQCTIAVLVGVVLLTTLSLAAAAQAKEDRISGRVHMVNKETSTITVRVGTNNVHRYVVYDANTKYTLGNKPGSLDDLKESARVICLGKFDDKARLHATRIEVRPGQ